MSEIDKRPVGARVSVDMIGSSTAARPVAWSDRDCMLYALGVGAGIGDPACDLAFTTENSEGITLQAIPSFVTVLCTDKPPALEALDVARFLHAGQSIELTRPIASSGHGTIECTLVEVLDKGSGAIVIYDAILRCPGDGPRPTARSRTSVFVRGGGGFDGPRGAATASLERPQRTPDAQIIYASRPEQALLYRLSGDRHRLHSDPSFARKSGFSRPILHGLCTYGFACRALLEGLADAEPGRPLLAMDARFAKPVYPGATLTTQIWIDAPDRIWFRTLDDAADVVLDLGTARISAQCTGPDPGHS